LQTGHYAVAPESPSPLHYHTAWHKPPLTWRKPLGLAKNSSKNYLNGRSDYNIIPAEDEQASGTPGATGGPREDIL
jgi:hypothetical protein